MIMENWALAHCKGGMFVAPERLNSEMVLTGNVYGAAGMPKGAAIAYEIRGYSVQERAFVTKDTEELVRLREPNPNYLLMVNKAPTKVQTAIEKGKFPFVVWKDLIGA